MLSAFSNVNLLWNQVNQVKLMFHWLFISFSFAMRKRWVHWWTQVTHCKLQSLEHSKLHWLFEIDHFHQHLWSSSISSVKVPSANVRLKLIRLLHACSYEMLILWLAITTFINWFIIILGIPFLGHQLKWLWIHLLY